MLAETTMEAAKLAQADRSRNGQQALEAKLKVATDAAAELESLKVGTL